MADETVVREPVSGRNSRPARMFPPIKKGDAWDGGRSGRCGRADVAGAGDRPAFPPIKKGDAGIVDGAEDAAGADRRGHVHLPREADWLDSFLLELLAFRYGKHDDQVDSVSQFLMC